MQKVARMSSGHEYEYAVRRVLVENNGEESLFRSGADLAKVIAALPNSPYAEREKGLSTLITQVFRGERNCPETLQTAILLAARNKLHDSAPAFIAQKEKEIGEAIGRMHRYRKKCQREALRS